MLNKIATIISFITILLSTNSYAMEDIIPIPNDCNIVQLIYNETDMNRRMPSYFLCSNGKLYHIYYDIVDQSILNVTNVTTFQKVEKNLTQN